MGLKGELTFSAIVALFIFILFVALIAIVVDWLLRSNDITTVFWWILGLLVVFVIISLLMGAHEFKHLKNYNLSTQQCMSCLN